MSSLWIGLIAGAFIASSVAATFAHGSDTRRAEAVDEDPVVAPLPPERVDLLPIAPDDVTVIEQPCPVPCRARHCADHAGVTGSAAQRDPAAAAEQRAMHVAWNTPTAEWDVTKLGLAPPSIEDFGLVRRIPGAALVGAGLDDSTAECALPVASLHRIVARLRSGPYMEEAA